MRNIVKALALLLLVVFAVPAGAQSLTGTVTGMVKDEQGGALPGVSVTLSGKTGNKTTTTGTNGVYRFVALDPGTYSVQTQMSGFAARRQDNIVVTVSQEAVVDFSLKVGGMSESLVVVGEAPVVDTTSSATNTQLSQDLLFNMPIRQGNTATNLLNFAPGINDSAAYGGDANSGNGLLIDGVDTRDPSGGTAWTFYNYNIVEDVQFTGIGAPAEYGAFTGAVVNTITKSGGNRFAGLFDIIYSKSSLASKNVTAGDIALNPSLAESAKINKLVDFTAQISGPIVKDKLFFFASAQRYQKDQDPIGPRTFNNEASDRFNGKLTWQPSASDNVIASLQFDNYNITGRAGFNALLDGDAITNLEDAPEFVWNGQWRHLFGSKTFTEIKYTGWWGFYDLNPTVKGQPWHFDENGANYGSQGYFYYADRGRHQVNAAVSHYADAFGHHDLKFGVEVERSKTRDRDGYNPNGVYYYDYGGKPYLAYGYSYDFNGRNKRESAYAQDSWKVGNRLTLNPGLRFDHVHGGYPGQAEVYTANNFAPRFGFAFDLTGDHRTVLKGSYSQYYEGIFNDIYKRATPGLGDHVTYDASGCPPFPAICGLANLVETDRSPATLYKIDPNIKHPRVDETSLGFEHALGNEIRLSVTGIFRDNKNAIGSVLPSARWTPFTTTDGLGKPITLYTWANRSASDQDLFITNPDGFQFRDPSGNPLGSVDTTKRYKALMFVANKRLSHRWQAQISYVLSKAYGSIDNNSEASFGNNSSTNGGGGAHQFETPNVALVNSNGELTNSRRHEVKILLGFQVPVVDIGINAYFRGLSGRPYTPYQQFATSVISFPASSGGRRVLLEPRGSLVRDSEKVLDLRLEKIFRVGVLKNRIALYADITNALNATSVNGVQVRVPSLVIGTDTVNYGSPTGVIDPRQVTVGARWSF
jgi:Carboxypeptidase regulatory-like domain/TonB dependent receptor